MKNIKYLNNIYYIVIDFKMLLKFNKLVIFQSIGEIIKKKYRKIQKIK
jgi:hypothetical protein